MASTIQFYDSFYALTWDGLDLPGSTVKVMLMESDYTFSASHASAGAVKAAGTEASGTGYTSGGAEVSGGSISVNASPKYTKYDADDVQWASLTVTFRYAIYYISGTVGTIVNPALACVLLDNTPADIVCSGVPYSLVHSVNGVFKMGLAA